MPTDTPQPPSLTRPSLTLKQSAQACAVSVSTIRRRLEKNQFGEAFKDVNGEWRIPVTDLLGAGFTLRTPARVSEGERAHGERVSEGHDIPVNEAVSDLAARLAEAEHRAAVAEAVATERERALARADREVDGLRAALRILEAGPSRTSEPSENHGGGQDHERNGDQAHGRRAGRARPGWLAWLRGDRGEAPGGQPPHP